MIEAGEFGWLLRFEGAEPAANAAARAAASAILAARLSGVVEVVPAARSVLVTGTPDLDPERLRIFETPEVPAAASAPPATGGRALDRPLRTHEIRFVPDGPDLDEIASRTGHSPPVFVEAFTQIVFTVGFLGFSPGFAYLYGLPSVFHLPRRGTPRVAVPPGSVALAGPYVGIYPAATPGGWNLLGTTQRRLFDLRAESPFLFAPGDRVRFRP